MNLREIQARAEELCAQGTRWGLSTEEDRELQRLVLAEKAFLQRMNEDRGTMEWTA